MDFKEKTLVENVLYKGKVLTLRRDEVALPDGKTAIREVVHHNGGSCIFCEKDGKILFVKQFRYAFGEEVLELPAGKREKDEPPEITALRELEEEGGIKAKKAELLFEVYPSPGYTDEKIYIYKATELEDCAQKLDEDEFLSAVWIDKEEVKKLIKSGRIKDGKTLIALLYCL